MTDVGAFYLAFALLLAWAAWRPSRELIVPVCTAFALFSALHLAWHCVHLDGFATFDAVAQTASLGARVAVESARSGGGARPLRRPPSRLTQPPSRAARAAS